MRLLISELSENHHETLLALLAYAVALKPEAIAVVAPSSWGALYQSLTEVNRFIPYEGKESLRCVAAEIESFRPTLMVHATAYGKAPLSLSAGFSEVPQVGVIHDLAKVRRFSWLQWQMLRHLRFFWVLRPGLYARLPKKYQEKADFLWSGVYPTSLEGQIPTLSGEPGKVYLCIPGRVEYKRRDYRMLLEVIELLKDPERFRFILLGPAEGEHSDYADFYGQLREKGWESLFVSFAGIVPFPEYHAYVRMSQAMLALIHPHRYEQHREYLEEQISGSFPLAQAHRKPLLLHRSFAGEADLVGCSYFYETVAELVELLEGLGAGVLRAEGLYQGGWYSFEEGLRRFRRGVEAATFGAWKG